MKIEYLLFNLIVFFSIILAKIFYRKSSRFNNPALFISIFIVSIIFIIIDSLVTGYFWNFNSRYILGIKIIKLPIEEILFFITVPFACIFLWINIKNIIKNIKSKVCINCILNGLLFPLAAFFWYQKLFYTFSMIVLLIFIIAVDKFIKTELFRQKVFLIYLIIINCFTFIFNLYLTARPVVIYSTRYKTNLNIITIPIEDFIFGICLISLNIIVYEYYCQKYK
jgi:lycopene cyclase domain-containing protein